MTTSEIIQIGLSAVGTLTALVVGIWQIRLARQMKNFEIRQDSRDKQHNEDIIFAEATRFIQKYSKSGHDSEIYLLPLCVAAYAYNPVYPYRRDMYREFCGLTEDIQNAILQRCELSVVSKRVSNFYDDMLERVIAAIHKGYPDDQNIFYDNGKYFERALLHHGESVVPDLRCPLDADELEARKHPMMQSLKRDSDMSYESHITNLLAWHKDEKPIGTLFHDVTNMGSPASGDEIVTSYLCCSIAEYSASYVLDIPDDFNSGYVCDFCGKWYMEDMFLQALYEIMIHTETKSDMS